MKTTKNYGLKKPESSDFYNVDDFNENADAIDEKLKELETPTYTEATSLQKLVSGEKLSVAFGKIAKLVGSAIAHFATKATLNTTGHVKLSDSSAVTDSTGLALPATEKNAAIGGTLANQISKVNSDLSKKVKVASSLKQVIAGRTSNTSESFNELRFEISDTEHYIFRVHDNTDQLIVWHYANGAYEKVWDWRNLETKIKEVKSDLDISSISSSINSTYFYSESENSESYISIRKSGKIAIANINLVLKTALTAGTEYALASFGSPSLYASRSTANCGTKVVDLKIYNNDLNTIVIVPKENLLVGQCMRGQIMFFVK